MLKKNNTKIINKPASISHILIFSFLFNHRLINYDGAYWYLSSDKDLGCGFFFSWFPAATVLIWKATTAQTAEMYPPASCSKTSLPLSLSPNEMELISFLLVYNHLPWKKHTHTLTHTEVTL